MDWAWPGTGFDCSSLPERRRDKNRQRDCAQKVNLLIKTDRSFDLNDRACIVCRTTRHIGKRLALQSCNPEGETSWLLLLSQFTSEFSNPESSNTFAGGTTPEARIKELGPQITRAATRDSIPS